MSDNEAIVISKFAELFRGRGDAYGIEAGQCIKDAVTVRHYGRHLTEPGCAIGIYPLIYDPHLAERWSARMGGHIGGHFVCWGCSDIDNPADPESALTYAANLERTLRALELDAWIERTKSKGFHVWVFADEWVPAIVMRRALLVAHQVAGVTATEVNPKQVDLTGKSYGNYVNLPFPYDYKGTERRCVIDDELGPIPLYTFVEVAHEERNSFDALHLAAKLYVEPTLPGVGRPIGEPNGSAKELSRRLPGLAYTIWEKGPLQGRDRSNTLQRFAHLCAESEVGASDAFALLVDADERWGKFYDRADGESHLRRMIEVAYG